jgi:hypothetical protein
MRALSRQPRYAAEGSGTRQLDFPEGPTVAETSLSVAFKRAAAAFVESKTGNAVKEITGWDEYANTSGGCPTCGPSTDIEASISFTGTDGRFRCYTYYGNFSELLTEILAMDME